MSGNQPGPSQTPLRGPIVAELGRPETPEETAARKAQDSRNHRTRQTVNNLVYSLIATVVIVIVIVLLVPRGQPQVAKPVDYTAVADQAAGAEPDALIAPRLPRTWTSNSAELSTETADGIDSWYIGLITPDKQFIGITQGFDANDSWIADQVNRSLADGTKTIDGLQWTVYDNRDSSTDEGNVEYAMTAVSGHSTFVLFGTAPTSDFRVLANAVAHRAHRDGASE